MSPDPQRLASSGFMASSSRMGSSALRSKSNSWLVKSYRRSVGVLQASFGRDALSSTGFLLGRSGKIGSWNARHKTERRRYGQLGGDASQGFRIW